MAMTDERITDEVLLHELERMRTHCVFTDGATHGNEWIGDMSDDHVYEEGSQDDCTSSHSIPFPPASTWQTTRRALLTCRELVRTERHYASALRLLLTADTSTSPPPLMLTYLSGLSAVSEVLLGRMEEDPSAWGVAAAFVTGEEDLESAYVGWCRVVGGFFAGKAEQARGGRWSGTLPRRTGNGIEGAWRKSIPSIAGLNAPPGVAPVFPEVRHRNGKARAKPNVRDLAILPTQRVTRYVLLYRGAFQTPLVCSTSQVRSRPQICSHTRPRHRPPGLW